MHNAPSVSYPVGRSRFAAVLLVILWFMAAVTTGMGWAQAQSPGWRWGGAALLLVAVGLIAVWNWWRTPEGMLSWDGESWAWGARGQVEAGMPEASLDLQRWLLVRWAAPGATRWFWLERSLRPQRWDDLRRAVYSRARPEALPAADPPAAKT